MEIISEGLILRPWIYNDAEQLAKIADNKKIADNLRDGFPNPYSLHHAQLWLKGIIPGNEPPAFFAIVVENSIAGSISIVVKNDIYRKNAEIGYFIAEEFWGRNIATKAIKTVTEYAFKTFDIVRVYAEPFADNHASRRALEKAGFRHEATFQMNVIKNNVIKDSCIYSILRVQSL